MNPPDRTPKATFVRDAEEAEERPIVPRAWPAAPGSAAFTGLPGRFVAAVTPHSESDPVALLIQYLIAFGSAVGRGPHVRAESDSHGANLFGVLVGPTSKGRKGTSWGRVRAVFESVDPAWARDRIASGLSSGEGLIYAVRDPSPARDKKGLADPGERDKRLLIFEAEMASALRVLRREGNTLSPTIRSAWDTGNLRTLTKQSPLRATGAHISIVAHVTKAEACRDLSQIESGNGFGNRFLWLAARRARLLPFGGSLSEGTLARLAEETRRAVQVARSVGEVTFDASAKAAWAEGYARLSAEVPGLLGAMVGRAEAQVLRLALVYALAEGSGVIELSHLRAALALWEYAERSAAFVFGDALGDPLADEILEALRRSPAGLTRSAIRDLLGRHGRADDIHRALASLIEYGHARYVMEPTEGRSRERWFAVSPAHASVASVTSVAGGTSRTSVQQAEPCRPVVGLSIRPASVCDRDQSDESDQSTGDNVGEARNRNA